MEKIASIVDVKTGAELSASGMVACGDFVLALLDARDRRKKAATKKLGYNPPPVVVQRPDKPTPAPPAKVYDKQGRLIRARGGVKINYDSKKDTQGHMVKVFVLVDRFVARLNRRGRDHDMSKMESPEQELFDKYTPLLRDTTYGSDEYKQYLADMGAALKHHYENNRHHPEHYEAGVNGMTLVDIIEMFCDWKAASLRHADGDFANSLEHNRERFGVGDQLHSIFMNTAKELELLAD